MNIALVLKRYMLSLPLKKKIACENNRHFATPPLISPRNDVWGKRVAIPHWWPVTTQIWVVLLIGWKFVSTNQKRDQYGITALVSRTSIREGTRGGVAKCFFRLWKNSTRLIMETLSVKTELKSISSDHCHDDQCTRSWVVFIYWCDHWTFFPDRSDRT